jgi:hypothetical protein
MYVHLLPYYFPSSERKTKGVRMKKGKGNKYPFLMFRRMQEGTVQSIEMTTQHLLLVVQLCLAGKRDWLQMF